MRPIWLYALKGSSCTSLDTYIIVTCNDCVCAMSTFVPFDYLSDSPDVPLKIFLAPFCVFNPAVWRWVLYKKGVGQLCWFFQTMWGCSWVDTCFCDSATLSVVWSPMMQSTYKYASWPMILFLVYEHLLLPPSSLPSHTARVLHSWCRKSDCGRCQIPLRLVSGENHA